MTAYLHIILNLLSIAISASVFYRMRKDHKRHKEMMREFDYVNFQLHGLSPSTMTYEQIEQYKQDEERFSFPKPWKKKRAWLPKTINDNKIWFTTYYQRENVHKTYVAICNANGRSIFYYEYGTLFDVLKDGETK